MTIAMDDYVKAIPPKPFCQLTPLARRPLTIFVHRASQCLTDHLSHGDGLICHSLLHGLAERGHRIFAYTDFNGVQRPHARLTIYATKHRSPANSLAPWEHGWRANRWLAKVAETEQVDLIWRMHPYGEGCPTPPHTSGRPLIIGPLFYSWPELDPMSQPAGNPRFGIGIEPMLKPFARRGWEKTLSAASLVLCATDRMTEKLQSQIAARVETLPVIVNPPSEFLGPRQFNPSKPLRLLLVANLYKNKHPNFFCETIKLLRENKIETTGLLLGDGPERAKLETWCRDNSLCEAIQFAGKVPNAEVYRHMHESNFLISTSVGEPYGRGIVEAMSVGTPAVCHRSGGPADFIEHGTDGLMVDRLEAAHYAQAISTSFVNSTAWLELSSNASRKAANWTPRVVLDCLERSLHRLVNKHKQ